MIAANVALFRHLESDCAKRGEPIPTAGAVRYVAGDIVAQDYLKNLKLEQSLRFGRRRSLTWLSHRGTDLVCLAGFECDATLPQVQPFPTNAGVSVCVLSELRPLPIATPSVIRNIVEVGSQGEAGYGGHDHSAIESLFPSIKIVEVIQTLDEEAAWRMFLMLCIDECRQGESWIDDSLADELGTLTDLNVDYLPYDAVCRSIFDSDPRSLYMALYRCLEATYAYESCRKLVAALGLTKAWHELAAALDEQVGWHPQEAANLNLVLQYALKDDLEAVSQCLKAPEGSDIRVTAGRAIYRLLNRIVHYGARNFTVDVDTIDWNELCRRMVGIVFHVFSHAFTAPV